MKVKEYLVNRILELEKELKQTRNEQAGTKCGLQKLQEEVIKLNEKLEQYQIEREHIKQIITCHLSPGGELGINLIDPDRDTLLAILDIKPEDYSDDKGITPRCGDCLYKNLGFHEHPCDCCDNNSEFCDKRRITNAENTD